MEISPIVAIGIRLAFWQGESYKMRKGF